MNYLITYGLPDRDLTPRGKAYTSEGVPSSNKDKWATFLTHDEAKEFAEKHGIKLSNYSSQIVAV